MAVSQRTCVLEATHLSQRLVFSSSEARGPVMPGMALMPLWSQLSVAVAKVSKKSDLKREVGDVSP